LSLFNVWIFSNKILLFLFQIFYFILYLLVYNQHYKNGSENKKNPFAIEIKSPKPQHTSKTLLDAIEQGKKKKKKKKKIKKYFFFFFFFFNNKNKKKKIFLIF